MIESGPNWPHGQGQFERAVKDPKALPLIGSHKPLILKLKNIKNARKDPITVAHWINEMVHQRMMWVNPGKYRDPWYSVYESQLRKGALERVEGDCTIYMLTWASWCLACGIPPSALYLAQVLTKAGANRNKYQGMKMQANHDVGLIEWEGVQRVMNSNLGYSDVVPKLGPYKFETPEESEFAEWHIWHRLDWADGDWREVRS